MSPEDFKRLWEVDGDFLCPLSADELSAVVIPADAREFLNQAGLPQDTAPFLSFDAISRGQQSDPMRSAMARSDILVIGANGSGDPVVVLRDGTLASLNHDAAFAETYINKDINTFAETALKMRHLIAETQRLNGPDAYLDGNIPAQLCLELRSFLDRTDPASLEPGALWADEIASWKP